MEKQVFHRQENESAKAFHAFILYRDMLPKERSIEKVKEKLCKSQGYYRHLARWSSKYDWVARATASDEHKDELRREAQAEKIVEMAERQAEEGLLLQKAGLSHFIDVDGKARVLLMKGQDAIRAIIGGAKLERIARGEPGEISKTDVTLGLKRRPFADYTEEELDWSIEHGLPIEARKQLEAP